MHLKNELGEWEEYDGLANGPYVDGVLLFPYSLTTFLSLQFFYSSKPKVHLLGTWAFGQLCRNYFRKNLMKNF